MGMKHPEKVYACKKKKKRRAYFERGKKDTKGGWKNGDIFPPKKRGKKLEGKKRHCSPKKRKGKGRDFNQRGRTREFLENKKKGKLFAKTAGDGEKREKKQPGGGRKRDYARKKG